MNCAHDSQSLQSAPIDHMLVGSSPRAVRDVGPILVQPLFVQYSSSCGNDSSNAALLLARKHLRLASMYWCTSLHDSLCASLNTFAAHDELGDATHAHTVATDERETFERNIAKFIGAPCNNTYMEPSSLMPSKSCRSKPMN